MREQEIFTKQGRKGVRVPIGILNSIAPKIAGESQPEQGRGCLEIFPPNRITPVEGPKRVRIFLAGSIDMGEAEDWQAEIVKSLSDIDCVIYNPRRKDWDKSWKQEIGNPNFKEQVDWELNHLDMADIIALCLTEKSKAPISLLELGLHVAGGKIVVFCPEGFWRKGNVDIICERNNVRVLQDFEDFKRELRRMVENKAITASDRMTIGSRVIAREFLSEMSDYHTFGSPLRSRPDYGEKEAEELDK